MIGDQWWSLVIVNGDRWRLIYKSRWTDWIGSLTHSRTRLLVSMRFTFGPANMGDKQWQAAHWELGINEIINGHSLQGIRLIDTVYRVLTWFDMFHPSWWCRISAVLWEFLWFCSIWRRIIGDVGIYPLVNVHITNWKIIMLDENSLFQWSFSIATVC